MKIIFWPSKKEYHTNTAETLLEIARKTGIRLDTDCSGVQKCGKCKVQILKGEVHSLTPAEKRLLSASEQSGGYRLACCLKVYSDLEVCLPHAPESSAEKIHTPVKEHTPIFPEDFSPDCTRTSYGLAFDIGTTTIVGLLWDQRTNTFIDAASRTNAQRIYGADVISRIRFCCRDELHIRLQQEKVLSCLDEIADELLLRNHISPLEVCDAAVAGNAAMSHLVLGISPDSLAQAPFAPVFCEAKNLTAKAFGLRIHPLANVFLLPGIGGQVGGDTVGMLLASRLDRRNGCHIAIDIGTNGEIAVCKDGQILTCSSAAGPAFEGASIYQGMRAISGAIESVTVSDSRLNLKTIENTAPVGLCGSGLIDAAAELLTAGILTSDGRMRTSREAVRCGVPVRLAKRIVSFRQQPAFVLAHPANIPLSSLSAHFDDIGQDGFVLLTQKDIREVQLAKGAIKAGIQTLMNILDIEETEIDTLMLAGAFGNDIHIKSAQRIGLLPQLPASKIFAIGNAAGTGTSMALLSEHERRRAVSIAKKATHIELSSSEMFQRFYISAMNF